jgi:gluconolactonase
MEASMRRANTILSVVFGACVAVALHTAPVLAQSNTAIPGVIAAGAQPELVQEGFVFTEGPLGTEDGGLYFNDNRASKTYLVDRAGKVSLAYEQTKGANGLALTREGDLIAAEGDGKRISKRSPDGKITPVSESYKGAPHLSPNDVIADARGGVYFTDPGPRPVLPGRPTYVFYMPAGASQPILIDDTVPRPNGIVLSPDGRTLYVDNTLGPAVYAYDVQPDGSVKNKRVFAELRDIPAGQESGADGMAIDRDGRLYVSSLTGMQVFDAKGQHLGTIKFPRQPANAAFAGPGKGILYVTAREGLYRISTMTKGPDRPGK